MSVAVVTWKSKISFLTKFEIMKLKIDAFSIFTIFLSAPPKDLRINSFAEQSVDKLLIIRKCRIPLLTKFAMKKLKTDVFSASMIYL